MKNIMYRSLKSILLASLCFISSMSTVAFPIQGRVELVEYENQLPEIKLNNRYLELTFLPDSMGRISQIRHLGLQQDLLQAYRQKVLRGNPLFAPSISNSCGIRELFWSSKMTGSDIPMELQRKTSELLEFDSPHYGNTAFALHRQVRLLPDSMILDFKTTIKNNGISPSSYSLWFNLLPKLPITAIIPVKGGSQPVRGRGLQKLGEEDTLFAGQAGQYFYAPAAPWAAGRLENSKLLMVICFSPEEMQPDGFFYSWGGITSNGEMRTFEPIFGSRNLKPGESRQHQYRILLLPGLKTLRGFAKNIGINVSFTKEYLQFEFAAASAVSAMPADVFLKKANEKIFVQKVLLPALQPEHKEDLQVKLPENLAPGRYQAVLQIGVEQVELIGAFLDVSE